ncbi:MAG: DMT family transporter [Erysipelotrichaceae bacterium]|nr:DMT family transporter [Erysipelotrichaceae bacterium]
MSLIFVILSSICYGLTPIAQTFALNAGLSPEIIILFTALTGLILSAVLCLINKTSFKVNTKELIILLICSVCGVYLTDLLLELSYTLIPAGFATTIHFIYPTLICIVNVIVFKAKPDIRIIMSLILSLCGLLLLGSYVKDISINGFVYAFLSAVVYGLYLILCEHSSIHEINSFTQTFYISIYALIISVFTSLNTGFTGFNGNQIFLLVLCGLLQSGGLIFMALGIKKTGSSIASLLSTLEPIVSLSASFLILKSGLTLTSIIGCILILLSLLPIIRKEDQL